MMNHRDCTDIQRVAGEGLEGADSRSHNTTFGFPSLMMYSADRSHLDRGRDTSLEEDRLPHCAHFPQRA